MSAQGVTVLPYSPIGSPSIDALGARCHAFYTALETATELGPAVGQFLSPDFSVIQSPSMPFNSSIYSGLLGAFQIAQEEVNFFLSNHTTIRVFTLGESHCMAYGSDPNATLVNNELGTFDFQFLEHSYWADDLIQSVKFYVYNTYPLMRNQMVERGADQYVEWKDADHKQREAAIREFDKEFPLNYDPHTV
ncbi:hypothetical protein D9758_004577 [Tetrapyrgos nigripes]|uniref:Uncharacterized protein n=1 Tax=Tetrapyrgos nigripes TaxID=182062 RepID=A0A8H5LY26_9AGAR|nr:hypothetical protein D9758_004577 [Tetrapyrgos nigripes]